MRTLSLALLVSTVPSVAFADCVYTGAKRAYLECIYTAATDALAGVADLVLGQDELSSRADTQDVALSDLDVRVTAAEQGLSLLSGDLAATLLQLQGDEDLLDDLTATVGDLETALSAAQTDIAAQGAQIGGLNTSVSGLTTSVSGLSSSLTSLSSTVSGVQSTVGTHTTQINRVMALENVRAILPKASANGHCPSGTAAHVPLGWVGQTGNAICAGDARGRTTCTSVQYVYITNSNGNGSYDNDNLACNQPVQNPWPWGSSYGAPNTLDGEWGHGDTHVVCCN
ncbi:MAG TPA: hypothetical protein PKA64_03370 [Myxococcota bacterium]|nr:hypothetical protein [Myxococcota bacterium]